MLQALLLTLPLLFTAQQPGAQPKPAPRADPAQDKAAEEARQKELEIRFQDLSTNYARAELEWNDAMRKAAGEPEATKSLSEHHPVKEYWRRFEELGNAGSGKALIWMAGQAERQYGEKAEIAEKKIALYRKLIEHHASDACAMEIVLSVSVQRVWLETSMVETLLTDLVKKTTNKEVAATALLRIMAINTGAAGQESNVKKAAEIRDMILRDYADTEVAKQLSAQPVYQSPTLQLGALVPELKGKDVEGAELDLGASRGKVVLLVFWGFTSPQCRMLLPHLKELAAQHAADPFAIVGVATDEDAAAFKEQSKAQGIGWRSAWDGGRNGPIAKSFKVRSTPTLYLIDGKGMLVKSWVTAPSDKALDGEIGAAIAAQKTAGK